MNDRDEIDYKLIANVFFKRKERVGARQIKMLLKRNHGVRMSRKKISRIKNKYGLATKIRRVSRHKYLAKKGHEHKVCANILNRNFAPDEPDQAYSVDITDLPYGKGLKAHLTAYKDLATKEIVSDALSERSDVDFVGEATSDALEELTDEQCLGLIVHSDQGFHFTHEKHRTMLERRGVTQSMSRRGNCLDNAPIESFFGHLKDHLDLKSCQTFEELKKLVAKEITYYNEERPQWGLMQMPPKEFRRHLLANRAF